MSTFNTELSAKPISELAHVSTLSASDLLVISRKSSQDYLDSDYTSYNVNYADLSNAIDQRYLSKTEVLSGLNERQVSLNPTNHISIDANGNIGVSAGVFSVNSILPDEAGNVNTSAAVLMDLQSFYELSTRGQLLSSVLYCISDDNGEEGGSNVQISGLLSSGVNMGTLTINAIPYQLLAPAASSEVVVTKNYFTGTKIATIAIDDQTTELYAPGSESQTCAIYRWQSNVDSLGQYSWFEIWPDGWIKQGGRVSCDWTKSGNTAIQISCNIFFNSNLISFLTTPIDKTLTNNNDDGQINYIAYDKAKNIISAKCAYEGASMADLCGFTWTAEGLRDTSLCSIEDISSKYSTIGTWSSNLISMTGTGGGTGGGVIDGTLLLSTEIAKKSYTSKTTTLIYTTTNDCLMYLRCVDAIGDYPGLDVLVNGSICGRFDAYNDSGMGLTIPVKKGSKISIYAGKASNVGFQVYEYALESLDPQIAIPDYSKGIKYNTYTQLATGVTKSFGLATAICNYMLSVEVTENSYVYACQTNYTGKNYMFLDIDDVTVFGTVDNDDGSNTDIAGFPVKRGSVIKVYVKPTGENYLQYMFANVFPCRAVMHADCVSYVIESGKFNSSTGELSADGDAWYRLYSDGWCEQGGIGETNTTITFHKPYSTAVYNGFATLNRSGTAPIGVSTKNTTDIAFIFGTTTTAMAINWKTEGFVS